jgi:hypothetical protein
MKVITDLFTSIGEERAPTGTDTPKDLHSSMARFFLGVLKKDGTVNEPDSLSSMYYNLDRPLLYLTLTTIKTSEFSTLGRRFLKRVRFWYVTNHLKRRHYRVCSPAVYNPL